MTLSTIEQAYRAERRQLESSRSAWASAHTQHVRRNWRSVGDAKLELISRGELNLSDAMLVRRHFIPLALESGRWNVVVFEAYRAIELLLKGIVCISGHAPRRSHEMQFLVDDFLAIIGRGGAQSPFLIKTVSAGDAYFAVRCDGYYLQILCHSGGTYTAIGQVNGDRPIDQLIRLRFSVEGNKVELHSGETLLLRAFSSGVPAIKGCYSAQFRVPDSESVDDLKRAVVSLRAKREEAFYGTIIYSESDALSALTEVDVAFDAARFFVFGANAFA